MSRKENEKIDIDVPEPTQYTTVYFYKGNDGTRDEPKNVVSKEDGWDCGAKAIVNEDSGRVRYFVRANGRTLLNPYEITKRESERTRWKWIGVPEYIFDSYRRFLHSRNTNLLRNAERRM